MASPTLTSLPAELFISILSHLPQRTTKTAISPLTSTTRQTPSKSGLNNLSFTNKTLRSLALPYIFEFVSISSLEKLQGFVEPGGVGEKYGKYVKMVTMRWDAAGDVVLIKEKGEVVLKSEPYTMEEFAGGMASRKLSYTGGMLGKALGLMSGVKTLTMDFPSAIEGLSYALNAVEDVGQELQTVKARNGVYGYYAGAVELFEGLGKLGELQSIDIDGTVGDEFWGEGMSKIREGAFRKLVSLRVENLCSFNDRILHKVMDCAENLNTLSVKNCFSISLKGTKQAIVEYGIKLEYLSLEIIKESIRAIDDEDEIEWYLRWYRTGDVDFADPELHHFTEDEHLCPAIRDHCLNLQILELSTNKICKEILFHTSGCGVVTAGMPTPPGSPDLSGNRKIDLPASPVDVEISQNGRIGMATEIPSAISNFQDPKECLEPEGRDRSKVDIKRQKLKRLALMIPYDSSCLGAGAGGPSPQQRFTTLCDGSPAMELLEIGKKGFAQGFADLVNVRGHWKGGPYLIMKG